MKKSLTITLILMVSSLVMAFTTINKKTIENTLEIEPSRPVALIVTPPKVEIIETKVKNHTEFLDAIGFKESTNNYKAVNQFGYLGKYQFGRTTLNALGYQDISNKKFLSTPSIQEEAMSTLLSHNKKILKKYIEKYDGKTINGIYITESGILAAAHLAGPSNLKKWFKRGKEFKDGNGTKMTSYLKQFADYDLYLSSK